MVLLLAHVALLVTPAVYPFIDLPFHLTAASAMRQLDMGQGPLSELFTYDLAWQPNVTHLRLVSSPLFSSVEWGNRFYLGAYALLFPLSALFLIRRLGGDPAISLLSFLLLYNFNLKWGFAGYILAVPLVLFFVGGLVSEIRRGAWWRRCLLSVLLVVIFWTHALAALFASLVVGLFALESWWRGRRLGWWWVPLPMWAILVYWWWNGHRGHVDPGGFDLWTYYRYEMFSPSGLWDRLKALFRDNLHLGPRSWRMPVAVLFTLAALAPLACGWRRLRSQVDRPEGRQALLFLVGAAGCSALLPPALPGEWAVFQRFSVFVLLAAIALGSRLVCHWNGTARWALTAIVTLHAVLYAGYFHDFSESNRSFRPDLFAGISDQARLAALIYDPQFRDQPIYTHFGDYFTVWQGGVSASAAAHFRFGVVRYRSDAARTPEPPLWNDPSAGYDGRFSGFDYLLVRGEIPAADRLHLDEFDAVEERPPWR
ncbi:MAG: hypothetical protein MI919_18145, partial [Holophagales bacterium]|nr:hypothetical protein [Holophagales bacterium]